MIDIFISYRTADSAYGAAACYELLSARFGPDRIFRDCVSMLPGQVYPTELEAALDEAKVLIAIIGPDWLIRDADGRRLVDRPRDWVRREIARALSREIVVIPALLGDTDLPSADDLPADIRAVARREVARIHHRSLGPDVRSLADQMVRLLPELDHRAGNTNPTTGRRRPPRNRGRTSAILLLICALALAAASYIGLARANTTDVVAAVVATLGLVLTLVVWAAARQRRSSATLAELPAMAGWDGAIVPRPEIQAKVVQLLLETGEVGPVALTTALRGAGGFGKTMLAAEVCRDPTVRAWFRGGVLWATVGERPKEAELAEMINRLCQTLRTEADESRPLDNPHQAGQELGRLLDKRGPTLLVVDDVWSAQHLQPFLHGGTTCVRLVTTRMAAALPAGARQVRVDQLTPGQALALLTRGLSELARPVADELLRLTGRWALLVALVNRAITEAVGDGAQPTAAAERIVDALRRDGPGVLDLGDDRQREHLVGATIDVSLSFLNEADKERFCRLGIFPEDTWIPEDLLGLLWGTGEAQRLCWQLTRMSLVADRRADDIPAIRLHDVVRGYLRGRQDLISNHEWLLRGIATLVETSADDRPSDVVSQRWWKLPPDADYLWRWLPYHLKGANRHHELATLVCDLRWITTKTRLLGPLAVEADIAEANTPLATTLRRAIAQSAHLLGPTDPPDAIVSVLLSRLQAVPELRQLIETFPAPAPGLSSYWRLPDLPDQALLRVMTGHTGWITGCAWSPDGTRLATASRDHTARIWDIANGAQRTELTGHTDTVTACAWSPDGTQLATASRDHTARIWDIANGAQRTELTGHTDTVTACAWSPDGTQLATASGDGTIRLWNSAGGTQRLAFSDHDAPVNACAWSPDGCLLATADDDGMIRLWSTADGTRRTEFSSHTGWVSGCAWSPDGTQLASCGEDSSVRLWDVAGGAARMKLTGHTGRVNGCAWSPDGKLLASVDDDAAVRVWNVASGNQRAALIGHSGWVGACAWSPDSALLASAGHDATVRVWDVGHSTGPSVSVGHSGSVHGCAWSPDGILLASSGDDQTIRVWDAASGTVRTTLTGHSGSVRECAWSPDGSLLVSASDDGTVRVWDADRGAQRTTVTDQTNWIYGCAWSPDGTRIATAGDQTVRVWDVAHGTHQITLSGHTNWVYRCAWSPDGTRIATAGDQTVRVWDALHGTHQITLSGHTGWANGCAWSADGALIASTSEDQTVRVWNAVDGTQVANLSGHTGPVRACAWSTDGSLLASAGDRTVRVWDRSTWQCVTVMRVDAAVNRCDWSPPGRQRQRLAVVGDGGVYVFAYHPSQVPRSAEITTPRQLR